MFIISCDAVFQNIYTVNKGSGEKCNKYTCRTHPLCLFLSMSLSLSLSPSLSLSLSLPLLTLNYN